jgi:hypothetical protein
MPVAPKIGFQAPVFVSPEPPVTNPPIGVAQAVVTHMILALQAVNKSATT